MLDLNRKWWVASGLVLVALGVGLARSRPTLQPATGAAVQQRVASTPALLPGLPAHERKLAGQVLDASNHGVRAHVLLKPALESVASVNVTADTDAAGAFELRALPEGRYVAWAWSESGDNVRSEITVNGTSQSITLRFSNAGSIATGIVRDTAGGVVVGAEVGASTGNAGLGTTVGLGYSDSTGRYRLRLPTGNYLAFARAAGYARSKGVLHVGAAGGERDFALSPAASIAGKVSYADARPAAGAALSLRPASLAQSQHLTSTEITADAQGAFTQDELEPGEYTVFAAHGEQVSELGPLLLAPGEARTGVDLVLSTAQVLSGKVESTDGRAIAQASVTAQQDNNGVASRSIAVQSDAQGRFSIPGLFAHTTTLLVDHPDYVQKNEPLGVLSKSQELKITLTVAVQLRGRVQTKTGEAVAGARVWASPTGDAQGTSVGPVTSSDTGEFALRIPAAAAPGQPFELRARHDRLGLGNAQTLLGSTPTRIVLDAARFIEGEVKDEADSPVPYAKVLATCEGSAALGGEAFVVADAGGVFRVGPLAPGAVSLRVQEPVAALTALQGAANGRARVELLADRDLRGVVLRTPTRNARLEGRIVDEHGQPVDGATVLAAPEQFGMANRGNASPALSDAAGAFAVERLAAGPHRLFIDAAGYAQATVTATSPGKVAVRLLRPATANGEVTGAGSALASATIQLSRPDPDEPGGFLRTVRSLASGAFAASGLAPGHYHVSAASADGALRQELELELQSGETQHLKLDLSAGAVPEPVAAAAAAAAAEPNAPSPEP